MVTNQDIEMNYVHIHTKHSKMKETCSAPVGQEWLIISVLNLLFFSCNESVSDNALSKCTRQGFWWVWSFLPSSSRRLKSSVHLVRLVHFLKKKNWEYVSPFFWAVAIKTRKVKSGAFKSYVNFQVIFPIEFIFQSRMRELEPRSFWHNTVEEDRRNILWTRMED
jgi:hypothetical protein